MLGLFGGRARKVTVTPDKGLQCSSVTRAVTSAVCPTARDWVLTARLVPGRPSEQISGPAAGGPNGLLVGVGVSDGTEVGVWDGTEVGVSDGTEVGFWDGTKVGVCDGGSVGDCDGVSVGDAVPVGVCDGDSDGVGDWDAVKVTVLGASTGWGVMPSSTPAPTSTVPAAVLLSLARACPESSVTVWYESRLAVDGLFAGTSWKVTVTPDNGLQFASVTRAVTSAVWPTARDSASTLKLVPVRPLAQVSGPAAGGPNGLPVGVEVGVWDGTEVGDGVPVKVSEGVPVGVGDCDGVLVGDCDGVLVGVWVGVCDGTEVGDCDGTPVGDCDAV